MRFSLSLILVFLSFQLYPGVFDTIQNISSSRQRIALAEQILMEKVWSMDSAGATCELEELRKIAINSGDEDTEVFALYCIARYCRFNTLNGVHKSPELFKKALDKSKEYGVKKYEAEITHALGENLSQKGDYKNGFKYMLQGDELMKKYGYEKFYHVSRHLYHLAYAYFSFGNYERTIHYLQLSVKYTESYHTLRVGSYNLFGMTYNRLNKPDTALHYFNKALNDEYSHTIPKGMLLGNMGDLYLKQGNYKKARLFLEEAYKAYFKDSEFSKYALAPLVTLADLEISENHLEEARQRLNEFYFLAKKHEEDYLEIWAEYYKLSTRYYTEIEDYKTAKIYQDSLVSIQNEISAKKDANMLANLEVQMITHKHLADITLMEKEKSRQRIMFNAIWIISGLIIIILLGLLYIVRLRQKKKQHELESEKKRAGEQLENYRSRLKFFVEGIRQKNKLIENLKEQLDDPSSFDNNGYISTYPENRKIIDQLCKSVILTKEDWLNFKKLFEKSHPGFILRLRMEYPNLTVAEIRLLMLMKLRLSVPEMANMLGISNDSVSRTSQRLRKKIGLSNPVDLFKLVEDIR